MLVAPSPDDPVATLELALRLTREVASTPGHSGFVRAFRPSPAVAFSRRETRLPGYADAREAALGEGFEPVVRATGGRAVAYDGDSILIDLIEPAAVADHGANLGAFQRVSRALMLEFRALGIDATVGAVPGEYCPGDYSIGARGKVKLVGISQRAIRGARLVSVMVVVGPAKPALAALAVVNAALGFDWSTDSWGSLSGEGVDVPIDDLAARLRDVVSAATQGPVLFDT